MTQKKVGRVGHPTGIITMSIPLKLTPKMTEELTPCYANAGSWAKKCESWNNYWERM